MAGQQHPFLSGFPNVQQSAMRTQFGGGQMVSGLMGPQQGSECLKISTYLSSYLYVNMCMLSTLCISL